MAKTTERSEIDDSDNVTIFVTADEPVYIGRYILHPVLSVRCKAQQTSVLIVWNVHLGLGETPVLIRADDEPAQTSNWKISTNHGAVFFQGDPAVLAKQLFGHLRPLARVTPYDENPVIAKFTILGLEESVKPVRKACHWSRFS